ncbi:NUDIX hydrolase [Vallitalea okinawensis]|uniref:NUDIX hydrolase n=1 Tax=Vallitalea okinawensis TaxID=2078660 RepID=UPI000CFD27D8|nr:NUDIX hydrolase [Vallitalea okinawensis]
MQMKQKWHRHLGVYGICQKDNKMLVIHKGRGPYSGRFDLPGGSIEENETMVDCLHREFWEETGIRIKVIEQLFTRDYIVPWESNDDYTHIHHIAIYYGVEYVEGDIKNCPKIDDSLGAEWINFEDIDENNSSPLVIEVKSIKNNSFN